MIRFLAGAAVVAVALSLSAGAASAAPTPTLNLDPGAVPAGGEVAATGRGFTPGRTVRLYLDGPETVLAELVVLSTGGFSRTVTVPRETKPGPHRVIACVPERSGCVESAASDLRVLTPSPEPSRSPSRPPGSSPPRPSAPGDIQISDDPVCCDPPGPSGPGDLAGSPSPPGPSGKLADPDEVEFPDLFVRAVEVTQNVQDFESRMPLVANRRTWIRVHPRLRQSAATWGPVDGAILLQRDSGSHVVLYPENGPLRVRTDMDRTHPDSALNFLVPHEWNDAGRVTVTALVWALHPSTLDDREPFPENNMLSETVRFHTGREPVMHVVPLDDGAGPGPDPTPQLGQSGALAYGLGALLHHPVTAPEVLFYPEPLAPGVEAKSTDFAWLLTTSEGRTMPLVRMFWYHQFLGLPADERMFGVFDGSVPSGKYSGWANSNYRATWSKPWVSTTAHELAHLTGLGHVDCTGEEEEGGALDPTYPNGAPNCSLAPVDDAGYFGMRVYDRPSRIYSNDPAHANAAYPLMSYQDPKWSDPYHWCLMLDFYGVHCDPKHIGVPGVPIPTPHGHVDCTPESRDGVTLELCLDDPHADDHDDLTDLDPDKVSAMLPAQPTGWLLLSGEIDPRAGTAKLTQVAIDGKLAGSLKELYKATTTAVRNGGGSVNEIRLQDGSGGMVVELPMTVGLTSGHGHGHDAGVTSGPQPFVQVVPMTDDVATINLVSKGRVLASKRLSAAPPRVSGVAVDTSGGRVTVRWSTSDPDGDRVTASVLWSADGKRWYPLVTDTTRRSVSAPADSRFPGGTVRVKVVANDGARTAEAVSKPFPVAGRAPAAMIVGAEDGDRIARYAPLELVSLAQDPEDGMLTGKAVRWASDRDGPLGAGRQLATRDLSVGTHVITLTAKDSDGAVATARLTLRVVDTGAKEPRREGAVPDAERRLLAGDPTPSDWLSVVLAAAGAGTALALVAGLLVWLHRSGRLPLPRLVRRARRP